MTKFEIPIEIFNMDDNGCHLFIKSKINRKQNCYLIIDTGASKTVFAKNLLEKTVEIIDSDNKIKSSGINADFVESNFCKIKKLQIEDFILKDYISILMDLSHINNLYKSLLKRNISGLIGGDFLLKHKAMIDYKKKKLFLYRL